MILDVLTTYAALKTFVDGAISVRAGMYFVTNDENHSDQPMQYYVTADKKINPISGGVQIKGKDVF